MQFLQKIIVPLLLASTLSSAFAQQQVDYKKEMLYIDGVAVAKVETEDKFLWTESVSFKTLKGKELIFAKHNRIPIGINSNGTQNYGTWWELLFLNTQDKLEWEGGATFSPVKDLVKLIGKNGLIKSDSIDSEAAKVFFMKYAGQHPYDNFRNPAPVVVQQPNTTIIVQQDPGITLGIGGARINLGSGGTRTNVVTTNGSAMAQRDRSQLPQVSGNQIIQGGVLIGTFATKKDFVNSAWQTTVTVLFPNGQFAGQAVAADIQQVSQQYYSLNTALSGSREVSLRPGQIVSLATVVISEMVRSGSL